MGRGAACEQTSQGGDPHSFLKLTVKLEAGRHSLPELPRWRPACWQLNFRLPAPSCGRRAIFGHLTLDTRRQCRSRMTSHLSPRAWQEALARWLWDASVVCLHPLTLHPPHPLPPNLNLPPPTSGDSSPVPHFGFSLASPLLYRGA